MNTNDATPYPGPPQERGELTHEETLALHGPTRFLQMEGGNPVFYLNCAKCGYAGEIMLDGAFLEDHQGIRVVVCPNEPCGTVYVLTDPDTDGVWGIQEFLVEVENEQARQVD